MPVPGQNGSGAGLDAGVVQDAQHLPHRVLVDLGADVHGEDIVERLLAVVQLTDHRGAGRASAAAGQPVPGDRGVVEGSDGQGRSVVDDVDGVDRPGLAGQRADGRVQRLGGAPGAAFSAPRAVTTAVATAITIADAHGDDRHHAPRSGALVSAACREGGESRAEQDGHRQQDGP